jgi:hypothetical protein
LLECGVSIDAKDASGQTALLQAAENKNLDIVRLPLEKGADVYNSSRLWSLDETITKLLEQRPFKPPSIPPKALKGPTLFSSVSSAKYSTIEPSMLFLYAKNACKFKAAVVHFYMLEGLEKRRGYRTEDRLSVFDLVYGEDLSALLAQLHPPIEDSPTFRWFHLPANNVCEQSIDVR